MSYKNYQPWATPTVTANTTSQISFEEKLSPKDSILQKTSKLILEKLPAFTWGPAARAKYAAALMFLFKQCFLTFLLTDIKYTSSPARAPVQRTRAVLYTPTANRRKEASRNSAHVGRATTGPTFGQRAPPTTPRFPTSQSYENSAGDHFDGAGPPAGTDFGRTGQDGGGDFGPTGPMTRLAFQPQQTGSARQLRPALRTPAGPFGDPLDGASLTPPEHIPLPSDRDGGGDDEGTRGGDTPPLEAIDQTSIAGVHATMKAMAEDFKLSLQEAIAATNANNATAMEDLKLKHQQQCQDFQEDRATWQAALEDSQKNAGARTATGCEDWLINKIIAQNLEDDHQFYNESESRMETMIEMSWRYAVWSHLKEFLPRELWAGVDELDVRELYSKLIGYNQDPAVVQLSDLNLKLSTITKGTSSMASFLEELSEIAKHLELLGEPTTEANLKIIIRKSLKDDDRYQSALDDFDRNSTWDLGKWRSLLEGAATKAADLVDITKGGEARPSEFPSRRVQKAAVGPET